MHDVDSLASTIIAISKSQFSTLQGGQWTSSPVVIKVYDKTSDTEKSVEIKLKKQAAVLDGADRELMLKDIEAWSTTNQVLVGNSNKSIVCWSDYRMTPKESKQIAEAIKQGIVQFLLEEEAESRRVEASAIAIP